MFIDGVKVIADPVLSTEEIQYFVAEEKRLWQSKNKQLGQLELGLDGEEVIVHQAADGFAGEQIGGKRLEQGVGE